MTAATEGGSPAQETPGKGALRAALIAARRERPAADRAAAATAVTAALLSLPEVRTARTIALYVSIGTEPSTTELLDALSSRGVRVILPVLRDNLDLDWAIYAGQDRMSSTERGIREPLGDRLGVAAVATADVVVVPALAVGADGTRLGRGGGSYDRALARVPAGRPVVALLHDGELLAGVPAEPHDRRVTIAVTPTAVHRLTPPTAPSA